MKVIHEMCNVMAITISSISYLLETFDWLKLEVFLEIINSRSTINIELYVF